MAPIDKDALLRCKEVLLAIVEEPTLLAELDEATRRELIIAAGRISRPNRFEKSRAAKEFRKIEHKKKQAHDRELRAETEIRRVRKESVFCAPPRALPPGEGEAPELKRPRNCYVCKAEFRKVHFFYESMCPECAAFNYEKRFQTARLDGRTALITGARLKIGYQASLMMLRAGARVIATTRFPHDAAERYAREADYAEWCDRLLVYGLDLRHTPSVELFTRHICDTEERLDLLINNAAQTVRRPPGFYAHMIEKEIAPMDRLPQGAQKLLRGHLAATAKLPNAGKSLTENGSVSGALTTWISATTRTGIGLRESAALSQIPYATDSAAHDAEMFPEGRLDADLQQVDLRAKNTWRLTLSEVATPEMLEVHLINAVAPFVLCAKLKPLMLRDRTDEKHVVNVSAMEGIFSRHTKTDKHPHTNMAKAALNMMTVTSAPDFARDGIFMNAVDTGWVTDEDPAAISSRKQTEHDFEPPLDIVDGAARVCDPFFDGLLTGTHAFGKFFKDYKPSTW